MRVSLASGRRSSRFCPERSVRSRRRPGLVRTSHGSVPCRPARGIFQRGRGSCRAAFAEFGPVAVPQRVQNLTFRRLCYDFAPPALPWQPSCISAGLLLFWGQLICRHTFGTDAFRQSENFCTSLLSGSARRRVHYVFPRFPKSDIHGLLPIYAFASDKFEHVTLSLCCVAQ